jgi:hypothetical protein
VEFGLKVARISRDKRKDIVKHYIEMVQPSNFAMLMFINYQVELNNESQLLKL